MQTRILDLDGSVVRQRGLRQRSGALVLPFQDWGPRLRLACRFGTYRTFERVLADELGAPHDAAPSLTFVGSGDFHHVSLSLLRRQPGPINLLVLDKHPDWMRGVPILHCGTWLSHAARLPQVRRIFHVGGEIDFDNAYSWLAPWPDLRSGKIVVLPAVRQFRGARWARVSHQALRQRVEEPASRDWLEEWLAPFRLELASCPLYISLDKDVLSADEAVVNWDSGRLGSAEVFDVVKAFTEASAELAGMDVVGDWSPARMGGPLRRVLAWLEHPYLAINPEQAPIRNEELNLKLLATLRALRGKWRVMPGSAEGRRRAG